MEFWSISLELKMDTKKTEKNFRGIEKHLIGTENNIKRAE